MNDQALISGLNSIANTAKQTQTKTCTDTNTERLKHLTNIYESVCFFVYMPDELLGATSVSVCTMYVPVIIVSVLVSMLWSTFTSCLAYLCLNHFNPNFYRLFLL